MSSYIEDLEYRYDVPTAIPYLFAALLHKDYNLELIRAVCWKIVDANYDNALLVPPLVRLLREGSLYAKIYAVRALSVMAAKRRQAIEQMGGLGLVMWHIYISKSCALLEACVQLVVNIIPSRNLPATIPKCLQRADFSKQLILFIQKRCGTQERYSHNLIRLVSSLIYKLATSPQIIGILLNSKCHHHLIKIIVNEKYASLLLEATAALGGIFLNGGTLLDGISSRKSAQHATDLALTLRIYTNSSKLQLCLNILIALRSLVSLHTIDRSYSSTQYWKSFDGRLKILHHLVTVNDFSNTLERCRFATDALLRKKNLKVHVDPTATSETEDIESVSNEVRKTISWFTKRIDKAINFRWRRPSKDKLQAYLRTYAIKPYN